MNADLYKQLKKVTPEEKKILDGDEEVQWEIYNGTGGDTHLVDIGMLVEENTKIYVRKHTRFVYFPLHAHNYVEIFYVYSGSVTHVIAGKKITVHTGELLFMNQHMQHEILPCGEDDIAINIIVMPSFFESMRRLAGQDNILAEFIVNVLQAEDNVEQYLYFSAAGNPCIQNLIDNVIYSILYRPVNDDQILVSTMELLFLHLISDAQQMYAIQEDESDNLLMLTVRQYIRDDYQKGTMKELASRTRYSVSSLSRLIKKYTGSTFKELQAKQRMQKAMQILTSSNLPISEIATEVGYENQSFFYKRFQAEFQMTPNEMRQKFREL